VKEEIAVEGDGSQSSAAASEPHAALFLALGYMRLHELLSCGRVCRRLAVDPPFSHRIIDEVLLELNNRTEGQLRSLHLLAYLYPRVQAPSHNRRHREFPVPTPLRVVLCKKALKLLEKKLKHPDVLSKDF
jgi:hypothetical protein